MKKLLLLSAVLSLTPACSLLKGSPSQPAEPTQALCAEWKVAEASWAVASQAVEQKLGEQRAAACVPPATETPPAPAPVSK